MNDLDARGRCSLFTKNLLQLHSKADSAFFQGSNDKELRILQAELFHGEVSYKAAVLGSNLLEAAEVFPENSRKTEAKPEEEQTHPTAPLCG